MIMLLEAIQDRVVVCYLIQGGFEMFGKSFWVDPARQPLPYGTTQLNYVEPGAVVISKNFNKGALCTPRP